MTNICIIDDGINENILKRGLLFNYQITKELEITERNCFSSVNSHGSICAQIIDKRAANIRIGSIKILNTEYGNASIMQLKKALEKCLTLEVKLIHLSIGTTNHNDFYKIEGIIYKLFCQGKIIISACSNSKVYTIPTGLPYVIGVGIAKNINEDYLIKEFPLDGVDIYFSEAKLNEENIPLANSFAAAMVTAIMCNELQQKLKINTINTLHLLALRKKQECTKSPNEYLNSVNPEKIYNNLSILGKVMNIDVPIIVFGNYGENDFLYILKSFHNKGFIPVSISNTIFYNSDVFYIPESINKYIGEYAKMLNTAYNPDLLLINCEGTLLKMNNDIEVDISIGVKIKYKSNKSASVKYFNRNETAKNIFDQIMEYYEINE